MPRLFSLLLVYVCVLGGSARAQEDLHVRIGVLTDMTGGMASAAGHGSEEAAEMAAEDLQAAGTLSGVSVIHGDYQNRTEVAQHITEDWIKRENVDVVVDVPSAAIASRLQHLFKENNRLLLVSRSNSESLYNSSCQSSSLSWLYDRDTLIKNLIQSLIQSGKKRWFILGSEDGYSLDVARLAKKQIGASGGQVVGEAQFRKRMAGLGMVLDRIEDVKADIIFLAFDRPDITHLLKNWPRGKTATPLALVPLYLSDIRGLTVKDKEKDFPGFFTITSFYWDQDAAARGWSDLYAKRNRGNMPGEIHAAVYASVRHYLQSVANLHRKVPADVMTGMKAQAVNDPLFNGSHIREDGLVMQPLRLLASKKADDRKGPWDYFRVIRSIPSSEQVLPDVINCAGSGKP